MIYKVIVFRKDIDRYTFTEYNCRDYGRALETFNMYKARKGDVIGCSLIYHNECTNVGKVEKIWKGSGKEIDL